MLGLGLGLSLRMEVVFQRLVGARNKLTIVCDFTDNPTTGFETLLPS